MLHYKVGDIIKKIREERKMTQGELAEGICSVPTLSRVENNRQMFEPGHLTAILERLGVNAENELEQLISAVDYEDFTLRRNVEEAIINKNYARAKLLVDRVSDKSLYQSGRNLQFILLTNAHFLRNTLPRSSEKYEKVTELLLRAVRETKPHFDMRNLSPTLLTGDETEIINALALLHSEFEDYDTTILLLYFLKENMEISGAYLSSFHAGYIMVLYNLSKFLGLSGKYAECIEVCDVGISACVKSGKQASFGKILFNKAYALNLINDKKDCKRLLTQAYYILDAQMKYVDRDAVRGYAEKTHGLKLV